MTPAGSADITAGAAGQLIVLPAFSSPRTSVLFCDADRASLAVFKRDAHRLRCEHHASVALPKEPAGPGNSLDGLAATLASLRSEAARGPVVLMIPAHLCLLKHLRIPRVDLRKRNKLVEFEAAQRLPGALGELSWDSLVSGEDGTNQEVLLAAAKTAVLMPLCAAAQAAGLAPQQVVPFPLALLAGCRLTRDFAGEPELVLHLGSRAATLLLLDRRRFAARSWLVAGDGSGPDRAGFAASLAQEVVRSVLHLRGQSNLANPVRLWLVGERTVSACDVPGLGAPLGVPVQTLELSAGPGLFTGKSEGISTAELGGAAAVSLLKGQATLNLLPRDLRTRQRRQGRRPWLVVAAAVLVCAPVAPLVQFHRMAVAAEEKTAEIQGLIAPWQRHEEAIRTNLNECALLERQLAAWQGVQEKRSSWLRLFADWQERFEALGGVWIERLQVLPGGASGGARLGVSGRMLLPMEPTESASTAMPMRARTLLQSLEASPFVEAVESERFDGSQTGMLVFDLVLVADRTKGL